ncbi:hypothetical protein [Haliangium sp. UPWRP_2]|uniref:hypothetical protein n=1 Tax=Haliangium sp. UPWRP_2 TaxID=1931276 RepID=UPI0011B247DB|nr:hypothetical protein [Haliangium sp. UPWRP_2]
MANRQNIAPILVGGLALAALLLLAQSEPEPQPVKRKPDPTPPPSPPPQPTPPNLSPDSQDDETALARVLASEDARNRDMQVVIAWITWQRAKRANKSIYQFVTSGLGYGPNKRADGTIVNAATTEKPTNRTRELARAVMRGEIFPSSQIRAHRPGSWAERDVLKSLDDDAIIRKQIKWKEGIYGQISGTKWILYSSDTPTITVIPFPTAKERLDALPKIPAIDPIAR